jgi:hypothetical protein
MGEDASSIVNGNREELWKINKQFIDNNKNNEFYFSHNPWEAPEGTFRYQEIEYLIDLGARDIVEIEIGKLWKVIW